MTQQQPPLVEALVQLVADHIDSAHSDQGVTTDGRLCALYALRALVDDPEALRALVSRALADDPKMVLEAAVSAGVLQHSEMHAQNGAWTFYSTPLRKVSDE